MPADVCGVHDAARRNSQTGRSLFSASPQCRTERCVRQKPNPAIRIIAIHAAAYWNVWPILPVLTAFQARICIRNCTVFRISSAGRCTYTVSGSMDCRKDRMSAKEMHRTLGKRAFAVPIQIGAAACFASTQGRSVCQKRARRAQREETLRACAGRAGRSGSAAHALSVQRSCHDPGNFLHRVRSKTLSKGDHAGGIERRH